LGLWDAASGRFGNIDIPLETPQPGQRTDAPITTERRFSIGE
jgi:hypothetical protein